MQITQEAVQRLDRDQIELMEVTQPAPGQALTCIRMRRTYDRALSDILVDSAALAALISKSNAEAMASTSAAPFSPAAARLIQQVQAEAREQLLADLSAGDTITVFHGFDAATKRVRADGNSLNISDAKGNAVQLHRHHDEPENWRGKDYMAGYWHPARWYGCQTLVDASGVEWERDFGPHVCDDFGNLVAVAQ